MARAQWQRIPRTLPAATACREPTGIIINREWLGKGPTWRKPQGHHSPRHIQRTLVAALATTLCPCHAWLRHSHCRAAPHAAGYPQTRQLPQCHGPSAPRSAGSTIQGAGGPWFGVEGQEQTLREGLCLLSHRHPSQSGHGLPGPCQLHSYREAPATWVGTDPRYPGLQQPWHGRWGWWALAVPEGLSAGEERAASLLHDCVCRAGLGEAVVPSSSLSCWADGCPLAAPAPGSVPTGPAPEGPWWDPGYLARRSHR